MKTAFSFKPCKRHIAGFTMGEMVIVIAIIAILAALIAPLAVNIISQKRVDACRQELKNIKIAIAGDPSLIEGGTRSSFGFVGDLGTLPVSLDELLRRFQTPGDTVTRLAYPQDPGFGWYWGWRGPYITDVAVSTGVISDPWGNGYNYVLNPVSNIAARIWSNGNNMTNDSGTGAVIGGDDISIDIRMDEVFSQVSGNTFDKDFVQQRFNGIVDVGFTDPIRLDFPNGTAVVQAALNSSYTNTAYPPIYQFNVNIPIGIRSIRFRPTITATTNSVLLVHINNGPMTTMNLVNPN